MSGISDESAGPSWIRKALAAAGNRPATPRAQAVGQPRVASRPTNGWDPYEVWLSRIERPRRRRYSLPAV